MLLTRLRHFLRRLNVWADFVNSSIREVAYTPFEALAIVTFV